MVSTWEVVIVGVMIVGYCHTEGERSAGGREREGGREGGRERGEEGKREIGREGGNGGGRREKGRERGAAVSYMYMHIQYNV